MLKLLNKIFLLKGNTSTFSMLLKLFTFSLICPFIFGVIVFKLLSISSIEYLPLFYPTKLLMRFYFIKLLIILILELLVVYVLLVHSLLIEPSLILEPQHVYFWVIHLVSMDINCLISLQINISSLEMLFSMNIFFPSSLSILHVTLLLSL